MADYRELAAALGGGYGQDTGPITPDTLITLKNGKTASAGDFLGLLKGFGQSVGSNLESLGRGGVASVIGAGGDLESFGRMGINKLYGAGGVNVSETPILPTSTDILGMMPRTTAPRRETAGMEELGGYMTPATAKVLKPAATGVVRMAGQEINAGLTGQPTRSLLGDITPKPKLLDVYHGTPHTLPPTERNPLGEFDASKIGTGEGAQSFGYGIYTAENPAVAKEYMQFEGLPSLQTKVELSKKTWVFLNDYVNPDTSSSQWLKAAKEDAKKYNRIEEFQELSKLKAKDIGSTPVGGNLYKVDLPDEKIATMLDWDKPMSEQRNLIEKMRKALVSPDSPLSRVKQFEINEMLHDSVRMSNLHPQSIINLNEPQIVERLRQAGIAGVKYFDEGSRNAKQGTRNFVVFPGEEKNMTILKRNAEKITK